MMEYQEFYSGNSSYVIYGSFLVVLVMGILEFNPLLLILSTLLLLFAMVYDKSSHIINPILSRKANITLSANNYRLSANMNSAVKRSGNGYKSMSIALLLPRSRIINEIEGFEEIMEKCNVQFEFSINVTAVDAKKFTEDLETKRHLKEIEISQAKPNEYQRLNRLKRELSVFDSEISKIMKGDKPVRVALKLKSFGSGTTESEASNDSVRQLERIVDLFVAAYGVNYRMLVGEELLQSIIE